MRKIKNGKEFLVVGLGASARGLEALISFFKNLPLNTNFAFVIIQHLSPDYKSLMDEILARETQVPIQIIENGMNLEPNNIYLIPPRKNVSLFNNKLLLEDQIMINGVNLPIDNFFKSLAKDKGKNAVGIILSGTGSDGTLGVRAIKEFGGLVVVQEPKTAKFDSMPINAISTGLVDFILPPEKMPEEIINYIRHPFIKKTDLGDSVPLENLDTFSKILMTIRDFSSIDFSLYKENTIIRRLERRISINRLKDLEEYLALLLSSVKEKETLYRELLIGVTQFFRDPDAFKSLKYKAFPKLPTTGTIRVWTLGCSTGEEVYSLAIMLKEYFESIEKEVEIKIFSTDVDEDALEKASIGFYSESVISDIEPFLVQKYFNKAEYGYRLKDNIRKMVIFAKHNVLRDPPFSKIDLILCRNLFIYFKPEIQKKVLYRLYYSLNPDGMLFMGSSETLGELSEAFEKIDAKWKIYKKLVEHKPKSINDSNIILMPIQKSFNSDNKNLKAEKLTQSIVSEFLPPSVILDANDNIIQVINDINRFLKIQPGFFSHNIFNNLSNELGLFVGAILKKLKKNEEKTIIEIFEGSKEYENETINVEGRLLNLEKETYYILSFKINKIETSKQRKKKKNSVLDTNLDNNFKLLGLEKELQTTKENLQATVEELETSNEELQSSNEELIASNEELQSSNEELQSVNEELYTVNTEYQSKIQELIQLNNDINNLLKNTEIGAIYIDNNLKIRKITPFVSKITNIIQSDVGRSIDHIAVMKSYESMLSDIYKVLENLQPINKEILNKDGKIYFTSIRPYRSENNSVEGILVTFMDITSRKNEAEKANIEKQRLNQAMEISNMALWEWDFKTGKVTFGDRKATMLGYTTGEFPQDITKIQALIHPDDYSNTIKLIKDHIDGNIPYWDITYRIKRKDGAYAWYKDHGIITERDQNGDPLKLIGAIINISNLKK